MADLKEIIKDRLAETFGDETQEVTASRLYTTQGNVSKWKKGTQVPTSEMLLEIAKTYKVSVDWLMGLSNEREIDGLVLEKLTYKQVAKVFDQLMKNNIIEIPDLVAVADSHGISVLSEDIDEYPEPVFDSEHIRIKDRMLAYIMRRRYLMSNPELDLLEVWQEKLTAFKDVKLVNYTDALEEAINAKSPASINKEGDWAELMQMLSEMSEKELRDFASQLKKKEGTD